jgi:hypothetical protein
VCLGTRMQAHQRLAFVFEASSTSSCNSALTHQDAGASAPCVRERSWPATPGCSAWVSTAVSLNTDQPPPSSRVAASDKIRPTRTTQEPGLMSADCTAARHPLTAPVRQIAPAAAAPTSKPPDLVPSFRQQLPHLHAPALIPTSQYMLDDSEWKSGARDASRSLCLLIMSIMREGRESEEEGRERGREGRASVRGRAGERRWGRVFV